MKKKDIFIIVMGLGLCRFSSVYPTRLAQMLGCSRRYRQLTDVPTPTDSLSALGQTLRKEICTYLSPANFVELSSVNGRNRTLLTLGAAEFNQQHGIALTPRQYLQILGIAERGKLTQRECMTKLWTQPMVRNVRGYL